MSSPPAALYAPEEPRTPPGNARVLWIGEGPPTPPRAAMPRDVRAKLDARRHRSPPPSAPPTPREPGGGSALERLPPDLATQLLNLDGYNLVAELLTARVSTRLREWVGDRPLAMVYELRPLLRRWRDAVFPPPRRRVNSFQHSPSKRKATNRAILFF